MKTDFARPLLLGALTLLAGCKGCRDDKPYTPFGVASAIPPPPSPSASQAASAAPSATPPEIVVRKAVFAPSGARVYSIAGRELSSPEGRVFEQLLEADFDGDGATEVAAWTLPASDDEPRQAAPGQSPGELWLYASETVKILDFPAFVPTGSDCRHATALSQPGARTLAVDIGATCETPRLARSPTRALALVEPASARGLRFGFRAADAAPNETLSFSFAVRDEDGDGRDDYKASVTLGVPAEDATATAQLVWLDRAAGISRDPREPARSLDALLAREVPRAKQKKTAKAALARVSAVRRLLGSLCAEGKVPRVFDWDGAPLRCGSLQAVVDRLAAVEVSAYLTLSDVPGALAALGRDGWYFGSMSARQRSSLQKEIEKKLVSVPAARIVLGTRPRPVKPAGYSSLAFDGDGGLLIQTDSGLMRLAPDSAREELVSSDAGIERWSMQPATAEGAQLIAVSYSCDRSELALLFTSASASTQVLPLLAPRPGACGGQLFQERPAPAAVSSQHGLRLLIGGIELGANPGTPPRGSARSPDGRWLAVPTPLGLSIQGERTELWKIDGDGWETATGCVVANDARRAACIRRGHAELYLKSEP